MAALGTVASEHFTGLAKPAQPLICITIGMPAFLLETIWFFFHFGSLAGSGHIYKTVCWYSNSRVHSGFVFVACNLVFVALQGGGDAASWVLVLWGHQLTSCLYTFMFVKLLHLPSHKKNDAPLPTFWMPTAPQSASAPQPPQAFVLICPMYHSGTVATTW